MAALPALTACGDLAFMSYTEDVFAICMHVRWYGHCLDEGAKSHPSSYSGAIAGLDKSVANLADNTPKT